MGRGAWWATAHGGGERVRHELATKQIADSQRCVSFRVQPSDSVIQIHRHILSQNLFPHGSLQDWVEVPVLHKRALLIISFTYLLLLFSCYVHI